MRDFRNFDEMDIKLNLLSGSKIKIDRVFIEPYTIREIKDFGYNKYMESVKWLTIEKKDFMDSVIEESKKEILQEQIDSLTSFDFYISLAGDDFRNALLHSLSLVFKTNDIKIIRKNIVAIDFEKKGFISKDFTGNYILDEKKLEEADDSDIQTVHKDNFEYIVDVVKLQNYLTKPEESIVGGKPNPANDATQRLMEQMQKIRDKVAKKKVSENADGEQVADFYDIVSAVSVKSNTINKFNIWDLTLYELYDEYSRLEIIDESYINIKAILAGAKDIKMRHWSSKI